MLNAPQEFAEKLQDNARVLDYEYTRGNYRRCVVIYENAVTAADWLEMTEDDILSALKLKPNGNKLLGVFDKEKVMRAKLAAPIRRVNEN